MTYKGPLIIGAAALITVLTMRPVWQIKTGQVLAEKTEITVTPSPIEATLSPRIEGVSELISPTPTIKSRPTKVPIPTIKPQAKYSSEQIYNMINQYAREKGVSPDIIRHMAICESGFRAEAKNGIYGGLFQYDAQTWKSFRKIMGENSDPDLRFDAKEAIRTTAYLLSVNKAYLWPNCIPK